MSGFIATLNDGGSPCDVGELRRLTNFLAFRGPDRQRIWAGGPAGLGHALLRTTREAEHEDQPLTLDGRSWIAADARVDGRKDLLRALARESGCHQPIGSEASDAELILRSYLAWGERCPDHLLGDFAFVIWDATRQRLFAVRDHFGVAPLFYAKAGGLLLISNTLDCLRQHPAVSDRLDDLAIADFLLFEGPQQSDATAFAEIRRLPPAHLLTSAGGKLSTHRYWRLSVSEPVQYRRRSDYLEQFSELLDTAITDRLRTENVGVLMSGGLDSTTVAASAAKILTRDGRPSGVRAYTEVFDRLIPHEERRYSMQAAAFLRIPIEFHANDDAKIFQWAARHFPEPVHTAWPGSTACQLQRVAAHGRVALTGLGADPALSSLLSAHFRELLKKGRVGRAVIDAMRYLGAEGRFSRLYIRTRLRRWFPGKREHPWYPEWFDPDLERRFKLRERWEQVTREVLPAAAVRPMAQMQIAAPLWATVFEEYDSGATEVPMVVRHPFFDLRLVKFLLALPTVPWCCDKELLRTAARGMLPEEVRLRRKSPLSLDPLPVLLQQPESAWVDRFEPAAGLERYVIRTRIPVVFREKDSWTASINLRPLSLNFWLRASDRFAINRKK